MVWFSCFVALMFARLASAQRFFDFCFFDFRSLSDSSELLDLLLLSPLLELGELLLLLSSEESLLSVVDESSDSDSSLLSLLSLSLPTETVRDKSIHLHSKYIAICSPSTPPFFFHWKSSRADQLPCCWTWWLTGNPKIELYWKMPWKNVRKLLTKTLGNL